jgi:hypothetical protein
MLYRSEFSKQEASKEKTAEAAYLIEENMLFNVAKDATPCLAMRPTSM